MPSLKNKTLNDKLYDDIWEFFKNKWGDKCGWAHTVLFAAELSVFKEPSNKRTKQQQSEDTTDESQVRFIYSV
jgi:N-glycosylase/DNA lyase